MPDREDVLIDAVTKAFRYEGLFASDADDEGYDGLITSWAIVAVTAVLQAEVDG